MKQLVLASTVAVLTLMAASMAQAAPVAPLPSGVTAEQSNVVQVQWWWRGRRWGHRRCWRGRFGRLHCRYW
jgi:hypothetical protein